MNSYIANSRIATGLRDGSITAIMVRCKAQPYIENPTAQIDDNQYCYWNRSVKINSVVTITQGNYPLPYALGKEVYVREAWGELYDTCDHPELANHQEWWSLGYVYGTDKIEKRDLFWYVNNEFKMAMFDGIKSPATMPKEAARTWITPVSVECKSMQEIDETNLKDLGYERFSDAGNDICDFVDHNKSLYNNNEYVFIYHVKTRII